MPTYTYETNEQPTVRVDNCSGNITITGWDQATIEIDSDELPEQFHQSQRGVELNEVNSDLALRVPHGATVEIDNGDGDVQMRDVAQVQVVNIAGDVRLQNIAGNVRLENVEGDLNIERAEHVEVRGTASGDVRIVHAARAAIEHVEGDARIEDVPTVQLGHIAGDLRVVNVDERCDVGHVEGDAASDDVQTLNIGHVGGDLAVARIRELQAGMIEGDCAVNGEAVTARLGNVGGDLALKVATGTLTMGNVAGDASFSGTFDQLTLGNIAGDLALHAQLTSGGTYRAQVAGDAAVRLGDDANLVLEGNVVGGIRGAGVRTDHPANVRLVWGAGEATLHISVIGDLVIHGPPPSNVAVGEGHEGEPGVYINGSLDLDMGRLGRDFANLGREIAASFGPGLWANKRGRKRGWQSGVGFDPQQKEQIRQQIRAGVEQARASVDRALREARVAAATPPVPPTPPVVPAAPRPAAPPAPPAPFTDPAVGATVPLQAQAPTQDPPPDRDAERLAILRMVSEGTISPEEAEDLLAALDS
jgi:DUF4097 and DUF4098 domain-containing protein YvlB